MALTVFSLVCKLDQVWDLIQDCGPKDTQDWLTNRWLSLEESITFSCDNLSSGLLHLVVSVKFKMQQWCNSLTNYLQPPY